MLIFLLRIFAYFSIAAAFDIILFLMPRYFFHFAMLRHAIS